MRIGLFTDTYFPDINGVSTSVQTLKKALEEKGHIVYIITIKKSFFNIDYDPKTKILRIPGINFKRLYNLTFARPFSFRGMNKITKMKLDIIHIHTEVSVAFFGRIVAFLKRLPIVYTYHTEWVNYTHYLRLFWRLPNVILPLYLGFIIKNSTLITCPSYKTQKSLYEDLKVTKEVEVIPTGIDLENFKKLDPEQIQKIEFIKDKYKIRNKKVLIYLGRMGQEKEISKLILAFARLVSDTNDFVLILCGFGSDLVLYKEQTRELNLEDKIIFTNKILYKDIKLYYNLADVFVTASMTETQGLTIIESLSCGTPVFAADYESLKFTIREGWNGYFYKNEKDFVKKIKKYFSLSLEKKNKIKANCFESTKKYSTKQFANKMVNVYKRAIKLKNSP